MNKATENLVSLILQERKDGNIVIFTYEGLMRMPIEEAVAQPATGLLYDLNRLEEVILTFTEDSKWVNDYALSQVVRHLKDKVEKLSVVKQEAEKLVYALEETVNSNRDVIEQNDFNTELKALKEAVNKSNE